MLRYSTYLVGQAPSLGGALVHFIKLGSPPIHFHPSISKVLLSWLTVFLILVETLECSMGRRYVELFIMYHSPRQQVRSSYQVKRAVPFRPFRITLLPPQLDQRFQISLVGFPISPEGLPKAKQSDAAKSRPASSWYHNIMKEKAISNCQPPSPLPAPR